MRATAFVFVILSVMVIGVVNGDPRPKATSDCLIDDWVFEWTLLKSGDDKLGIRKNAETTVIVLSGGMAAITLTPEAAVEVGKALSATDTQFANLKGKKDARESVDAGNFAVDFVADRNGRFFVSVHEKNRRGMFSAMLDRKAAGAFAPLLSDAIAKCKCVDDRINP